MQVNLRLNYRVQVSRMIITPLAAARAVVERTSGTSAPEVSTHSALLLLTRNSRHRTPGAHLIYSGPDSSLLPPRHRCYGLLSSALSRLVLESRRNSY